MNYILLGLSVITAILPFVAHYKLEELNKSLDSLNKEASRIEQNMTATKKLLDDLERDVDRLYGGTK